MMNMDMKKVMSYISAVGAAIVCMVMIFFEVINRDIPALVWFAFSMFLFAYAFAENSLKKAKMNFTKTNF